MRPDALSPVLAFDTARAHCAGALLLGDRVVARVEPMAKGQAERLMPLLGEMLAAEGLAWRDLAALGVGTGPGNFTGTRIAVAAARGLALGLGVPAVGVSAFEALALLRPGAATLLVSGQMGLVHAAAPGGDAEELTEEAALARPHPIARLDEASAEEATGAIARIAAARATRRDLPRPAPLYVRAPDAAPPRDPAPAILPG